jgi:hypothetical protein
MMPAMKVYILGIDHNIQDYDKPFDAATRKVFETLVREIVTEHDIKFIGDETYPHVNAVAKCIAAHMGVRWEPIEMSLKAREELGIADEQKQKNRQQIDENFGEQAGKVTLERVPSDAIREDHMCQHAIKEAAAAKSILILCGFRHTEELGQRFKKQGHQVTLNSLCRYSWYSHPECTETTLRDQ